MRPRVLFVLFAAATFAARVAEGAPSEHKGARLAWVRGIGADRCVGQIALEDDVKARLHYDPFALAGDVRVEGTVVQVPSGGYRAEIVVRDPNGKILGTRQLGSRELDCRALGQAVAVAITVAIDPDAPMTPVQGPEPSPFVEEPRPAPLPPPPAPRERGSTMLTGGVAVGIVPSIAPMASLHVRMNVTERLTFGLGAHFIAPSRTEGVGFSVTSGAFEICAVPFAGASALRWCGAFHLGAFSVFVHAPELAPVEVGAFPWLAAETGPQVAIPIGGPVRFEIGASAFVPITRRQAFVRGQPEPLWEQAVVAGRGAAGLGVVF